MATTKKCLVMLPTRVPVPSYVGSQILGVTPQLKENGPSSSVLNVPLHLAAISERNTKGLLRFWEEK